MPNMNRKEELELKKAKLEALRKERQHREASRKRGDPIPNAPTPASLKKVDTEKILVDLGIGVDGKVLTRGDVLDTSKSQNSSVLVSKSRGESRKPPKLIISKLNELSLTPTTENKYSKDTQTTSEIPCETPSLATDTWPETPSLATGQVSKGLLSLEWDDDLLGVDGADPLTEQEVSPIFNQLDIVKHVQIQETPLVSRSGVKELTDEEKENIQLSEEFHEFFFRTSAFVEGALEEDDRDIFFDYTGADKEEELTKGQLMLTEDRIFFNEKWTSRRIVAALDWSPHRPETVLAAYSTIQREELALTPVDLHSSAVVADGVCLLWNLKVKKSESAPETVFTCQAPVTTAIFSDFHPNLIIAGTYVGQVVIWDTRVNRQIPVQRTGLAGNAGHWEPIRSVAVTNSQATYNLISVSADGKLCAWSLDMLAQPFQTMELVHKQAKAVAPSSVAFIADADESFLIGAQDGSIYAGSRCGNVAGLSVQFEGHHQAPVTAISVPSQDEHGNTPRIYLTTSMDCSAKLWSRTEVLPLVSFDERSDYLLHCDWSPSHPALFATVDLGGHLDIWNLNMNSEVPTASTVLTHEAAPNCCKFEKKGSHIAVGDDSGRTRVFAINDKIGSSHADEWTVFEQQLQQLTEAAIREQKNDSLMRDFAFDDL